jgi:SPP1 family predicted phage head-tail adaptor
MLLKRKSRKNLASQCNRYVSIQERTYTKDKQGGRAETWSDVSGLESVGASIMPISSMRKEEFRTFNVDATHEIMLRGEITVVEANNRVKWGERVFEIKTVEDIQEKGTQLFLLCLERRV